MATKKTADKPTQTKAAAEKAAPPKEKKVKAAAKGTVKKAKSSPAKAARACKIASCKRPYRAKGYCRVHYKKWRQGEYGKSRYKTCTAMECRKPMALNHFGWCEEHYLSEKGKRPVHREAEAPAEAPQKETA